MANRESYPVSPVKLTALVNFVNPDGPEDTTASVVITGQTWVNENSVILVTFAGTTPDHEEPDDAMVEGLTGYVGDIISGIGFTIFALAPNGTWGNYQATAVVLA
jgi:hypothetical protein